MDYRPKIVQPLPRLYIRQRIPYFIYMPLSILKTTQSFRQSSFSNSNLSTPIALLQSTLPTSSIIQNGRYILFIKKTPVGCNSLPFWTDSFFYPTLP